MKKIILIVLFAISVLSANIVSIYQSRGMITATEQLKMQITSLKLTVNSEKKEVAPSDLYTHFFCPFCGEAQRIEEERFDRYIASCYDCKNGYFAIKSNTKNKLLENLNKIGVKIFTKKEILK